MKKTQCLVSSQYSLSLNQYSRSDCGGRVDGGHQRKVNAFTQRSQLFSFQKHGRIAMLCPLQGQMWLCDSLWSQIMSFLGGKLQELLNNLPLALFLSAVAISSVPVSGYFFFFNYKEKTTWSIYSPHLSMMDMQHEQK